MSARPHHHKQPVAHKPPVAAAREVKDACKKRLILVVDVKTGALKIIVKRKVSVIKDFFLKCARGYWFIILTIIIKINLLRLAMLVLKLTQLQRLLR